VSYSRHLKAQNKTLVRELHGKLLLSVCLQAHIFPHLSWIIVEDFFSDMFRREKNVPWFPFTYAEMEIDTQCNKRDLDKAF
jgi:phenylalanyl-tRNA synthetase alpha subunit